MQRDPRIHEHRFNPPSEGGEASPQAFSFPAYSGSTILFLVAPNPRQGISHVHRIIQITLDAIVSSGSQPTLDTDEEIFTRLLKHINTSLGTVAPLSTLNEQASSVLCMTTNRDVHIASHGPDIHIAYSVQSSDGSVHTKRITPTYGAYKKAPHTYFEDYTTAPMNDKTALIAATKLLFEYLTSPSVIKSALTLTPAIMYEHIAKTYTDETQKLADSGMLIVRPTAWHTSSQSPKKKELIPLKNKERPTGSHIPSTLRLARSIKIRNLLRFLYGRWSVWYGVCMKYIQRSRASTPVPFSLSHPKKHRPTVRRTIAITVFLLLGSIILVLFMLGMREAREQQQKKQSISLKTEIVTQVSDLLARSEGTLMYGDAAQTKITLQQARELLSQLDPSTSADSDTVQLHTRIQSLQAQVLGQTIVDRKVIADISELFPKATPVLGIFSLPSGLYAYNETSIARINTTELAITATAPQGTTIRTIEHTADASTLACLLSDGTIALIGAQGTLSLLENAAAKNTPAHFVTFASALYSVSGDGTGISKSVQTLGAFAQPTVWSRDPIPPPDTITGMTIDGSIYISTPTTIVEFLRGMQTSRVFSWNAQTTSTIADIITGARSLSLYAVDPQAGIVYEFNKTSGRTTAQYKIDLREYKGITISSAGSELYLLDGATIISIPLLRR